MGALTFFIYLAVAPPSRMNSAPVEKDDSSDARKTTCNGGGIDDRPAAFLRHQRHNMLHPKKHAGDIDAHHAIKIVHLLKYELDRGVAAINKQAGTCYK